MTNDKMIQLAVFARHKKTGQKEKDMMSKKIV
jgi:hypothetical protein